MDGYTIIAENTPLSEQFSEASFRTCLYEDATWSQDAYWKVEWALHQLVAASATDAALRARVFRLFSVTTALFTAHFDPDDVYVIDGIGADALHTAMARFRMVFEDFFAGTIPDLATHFDEPNPLLCASD